MMLTQRPRFKAVRAWNGYSDKYPSANISLAGPAQSSNCMVAWRRGIDNGSEPLASACLLRHAHIEVVARTACDVEGEAEVNLNAARNAGVLWRQMT
jgi:hypothetical protein